MLSEVRLSLVDNRPVQRPFLIAVMRKLGSSGVSSINMSLPIGRILILSDRKFGWLITHSAEIFAYSSECASWEAVVYHQSIYRCE